MTVPILMKEVLSLTKAGRLADATALLKQSLPGSGFEQMPAGSAPAAAAGELPLLPLTGTAKPKDAAYSARTQASPEGFARQSYAGPEGRIAYRLFVPGGLTGPAPLIVMLHGCTQNPEDFARGTGMNDLATELGFIVAYPEQTAAANPQKCWNWFRPGDQERGRGEPALLAALTRQIIAAHPVDGSRVYVAGLSAGGAAASIMAHAYPDLYAAVGIHSGLACGSAKDVPSAFSAMKGGNGNRATRIAEVYVPTITFHGDRDQTVHPSNSEAILATGTANPKVAGFERRTTKGRSAGGRDYRRTVLVDADGRNWIEHWEILGGGHSWSGGDAGGSYTDPSGPEASRAIVEFFLQHRLAAN